MKIVKIFCFILLNTLFTCGQKIPLIEQPNEMLTFDKLPNKVQSLYLEATQPTIIVKENDTTKIFETRKYIICPEKEVVFEYKDYKGNVKHKYIFTMNGKSFYLPFMAGKFRAPYIFYKKQLYYMEGGIKSFHKEEVLRKHKFGKFDLSSFFPD